jgi:hypothetical protein
MSQLIENSPVDGGGLPRTDAAEKPQGRAKIRGPEAHSRERR